LFKHGLGGLVKAFGDLEEQVEALESLLSDAGLHVAHALFYQDLNDVVLVLLHKLLLGPAGEGLKAVKCLFEGAGVRVL